MPAPTKAFACNCSICSRAGWLLAFVGADQFRLISGEESLTDYQFGKRAIHHKFCRTCGMRAFSQGQDKQGRSTFSINLRCLEEFDATALPVETFDGASL